MTDDELTKKAYLEVLGIIDQKFLEQRKWMKETFVCKIHCGSKRGKINIKLVAIGFIAILALGLRLTQLVLQHFKIF